MDIDKKILEFCKEYESTSHHKTIKPVKYHPTKNYIYYKIENDLYRIQNEKIRDIFLTRTYFKIYKSSKEFLVLYNLQTVVLLGDENSYILNPFLESYKEVCFNEAIKIINNQKNCQTVKNKNFDEKQIIFNPKKLNQKVFERENKPKIFFESKKNKIFKIQKYYNIFIINSVIVFDFVKLEFFDQRIETLKILGLKCIKIYDNNTENTKNYYRSQELTQKDYNEFPSSVIDLFSKMSKNVRVFFLSSKINLKLIAFEMMKDISYVYKYPNCVHMFEEKGKGECKEIFKNLRILSEKSQDFVEKNHKKADLTQNFYYFHENIKDNSRKYKISSKKKIFGTKNIEMNNYLQNFNLRKSILLRPEKLPKKKDENMKNFSLDKILKFSHEKIFKDGDITRVLVSKYLKPPKSKFKNFISTKDLKLFYKAVKNKYSCFKEVRNILSKKVLILGNEDDELNDVKISDFKMFLNAGMGSALFYLGTNYKTNTSGFHLKIGDKFESFETHKYFQEFIKPLINEMSRRFSSNKKFFVTEKTAPGKMLALGIKGKSTSFNFGVLKRCIENSDKCLSIMLTSYSISKAGTRDNLLTEICADNLTSGNLHLRVASIISLGFLGSSVYTDRIINECNKKGYANENFNFFDEIYRLISALSLGLIDRKNKNKKKLVIEDKFASLIANGVRFFNTGNSSIKSFLRYPKTLEGVFYYNLLSNTISFTREISACINNIECILHKLEFSFCMKKLCEKKVEGKCLHCYIQGVNGGSAKLETIEDANSHNHNCQTESTSTLTALEEFAAAGQSLYCCIKILKEGEQKTYRNKIIQLALKAEHLSEILFETLLLGLTLMSNSYEEDLVRIIRRQIYKWDRNCGEKKTKYFVSTSFKSFDFESNGANFGKVLRYKNMLGLLCSGFGLMKVDIKSEYFIFSIISTFYIIDPISLEDQPIFNEFRSFILLPLKSRYALKKEDFKCKFVKASEKFKLGPYKLKKSIYVENKFLRINNLKEEEKKIVVDVLDEIYKESGNYPFYLRELIVRSFF